MRDHLPIIFNVTTNLISFVDDELCDKCKDMCDQSTEIDFGPCCSGGGKRCCLSCSLYRLSTPILRLKATLIIHLIISHPIFISKYTVQ